MRGVRTVPVLLDIAADMERLCPNALHINYANPMAMNCWGLNRGTKITTVGLCHSVPLTAMDLCDDIGVPFRRDQLHGCRHQPHGVLPPPRASWRRPLSPGTGLPRVGSAAGPVITAMVRSWPTGSATKSSNARRFFVTESSEHFSEYVPWFIKRDRPDLLERFDVPLDEYIRRCENQIAGWETLRASLEDRCPRAERRTKRGVRLGHHPLYGNGSAIRCLRQRGQ